MRGKPGGSGSDRSSAAARKRRASALRTAERWGRATDGGLRAEGSAPERRRWNGAPDDCPGWSGGAGAEGRDTIPGGGQISAFCEDRVVTPHTKPTTFSEKSGFSPAMLISTTFLAGAS